MNIVPERRDDVAFVGADDGKICILNMIDNPIDEDSSREEVDNVLIWSSVLQEHAMDNYSLRATWSVSIVEDHTWEEARSLKFQIRSPWIQKIVFYYTRYI